MELYNLFNSLPKILLSTYHILGLYIHVVEGQCLAAVGDGVGGTDQVGVVVNLVGMVLSLVDLVADLARLMVDLFGLEVDWVRIVMGLVGLDHSLRGPLLTTERFAGERGRDGGHDHQEQPQDDWQQEVIVAVVVLAKKGKKD